jgi:hypothetical protein
VSDITIRNNDLLNAAFSDERLLSADLAQLKRYLLACTEMRDTDILNPRVKEGLPKRTEFIKQLIQLKQMEITQRELAVKANWSIGISLGTFLLLVIKTLFDIWRH